MTRITEALQEALKLCSLADTMTACRGDDDFIAGVRAKIEAALSTEPGEAEGWRDMSSAPKEEGRRILAWCKAAESDHGIVELIWTGTGWRLVVDHPWPNACLNPRYWRNSPAAPLPEDTHHGR